MTRTSSASFLQLAAIFAGFVVALSVVALMWHRQSKAAVEASAMEALYSSSRLSAHGLNLWIAERHADAATLADNPLLTEAMVRWFAGRGATGPGVQSLQAHLDSVLSQYDYRSIALIDAARGQVLFGSGRVLSPEHSERVVAAVPVTTNARSQWVELPPAAGSALHIGMARGIPAAAGLPPLALYLEFESQHIVATLKQAQPENWRGETLLVRGSGADADYLSSDPGSGLQRLPPHRPDAGAVVERALLTSDAATMRGTNRNGVPVLATREPVNMPSWYLVGMLDESTVYAPLERQTRTMLLTLAALLVLGGLAFEAWRRSLAYRQALRETGVRRYYEEVLRNGDDMFLLTDDKGTILQASESALKAYGYPRAQMLGMPAKRVRTHARTEVASRTLQGMRPGDTRAFQDEHVRADGSPFMVEGSVGLVEVDGKRYYHMLARDVSERRKVEAQLRIAASFFERFDAAVIVRSGASELLSANPAFTRITGYVAGDVTGRPADLLFAEPDSDKVRHIREQVREQGHWEGEAMGRRKNGEVYPVRILTTAYHNAAGEIEQIVDIFTDLSVLKKAEHQAQYLTHYDALTGLPHRAQLQRHLRLRVERCARDGESITVALLNLDRFLQVNESLGNAHGDALLVAVAGRLRTLFPDPESLFRYGGDEFVLVMAGTPLTHAVLLEQVRHAIAPAIALGEHAVCPTASMGVASFPEQADGAEALLRNVEAAMRMAKSQGRNTWRLYDPGMNASVVDDMLLAADLRQAMDRHELQLHLQPQYRLADGALVGMEALLRWHHAGRGMVSPARFIPIAESSGLIIDLSAWVLREACRLWAGWRDAGLAPPPVAINLSALQFQQAGFVQQVARAMAALAIPPQALEMELTESLIMGDTAAAVATMHQLVGMGIGLAIDDFGTGYSSLSYLRRFPVGKLKIDRSFVLDLDRGREGAAIASAIISMGKSLNLKVIAEGVETESQRDFLRDQGCDEVQGYLYSRPLAPEQMAGLLRERASVAAELR